jgi:hypothetical protein
MVIKIVQLERQQVSKQCRDLATFMETLIDNISKSDLKVDLPHEEQSFSVSLNDLYDYFQFMDTSKNRFI